MSKELSRPEIINAILAEEKSRYQRAEDAREEWGKDHRVYTDALVAWNAIWILACKLGLEDYMEEYKGR